MLCATRPHLMLCILLGVLVSPAIATGRSKQGRG